jgi:NAD(P)-dependent dehydrogenase (short-subunit alcohol dehydrogenase family)
MKKAMVWGSSGGIGSALVKRLKESGWDVASVSRREDTSEVEQLYQADVSNWESVQSVAASLRSVSESFDLLVYAIGDIAAEKVSEQNPEDWKRILDANLGGAYVVTHFTLPLLAEDAHIVFIGAVSEKLSRVPRLAAYAAAKAGLESFVRVLAREERKRRIAIIRPIAVETAFWDRVPFSAPPHSIAPDDLAGKILNAYDEGHKGTLDI